jgi:DNA gyrase subunit A
MAEKGEKNEASKAKEISRVKQRIIEDEMKDSYLDYSMSVIVGRALPDIRDGLKPVHRRILYAMYDMGMFHSKPYKKSARIVGETLGKYHPHGDIAVYDALVRMVQPFSLRYPLIDGQGNFGSVDGDAPAAMRYTEARMARISETLLEDIEKETVPFRPNFDGSLKEPIVLPAKLPNLLVNGSSGIAVGMATNIPPHNLGEVVDGIIATIDNPNITVEELIDYIKGPDFPTGGQVLGKSGIMLAYKTGKGSISVRGKAEIEETRKRERIIITEIPYQINKARLIESIANLVREKKIRGITNLRDESDKEGMRIIVDVAKTTPADIVLNSLYKHTQLQTTFGVILLSLVDGQPRVLNLKEMVEEYIRHRKQVVIRRTKFELNKASDRAHILEGLIIALNNIDNVVKTVKTSKNVEIARKRLVSRFKLSVKQAQAILDMRLQRLTSLEQKKVKNEHKSLIKLIAELKDILAKEEKIYGLIKKELLELKKKFGDERRTELMEVGEETIEDERLIKKEDVVITITQDDYVKRIPLEEYKKQRRGGKGIIGTRTKEGDIVERMFITNSHDYLLCFTNKGRIYWIRAFRIPEASRYGRGKPIVNLLRVSKNERVKTIIPIKGFEEGKYLFFATKRGLVKKSSLSLYSHPRPSGIIAIKLKEGDDLIDVRITDGEQEIILATKFGLAIRFNEKDARPMGRSASGVIGIRFKKENDEVVGVCRVERGRSLFTVTENGFGKRSDFELYRLQRRGGKGVINLKVTGKTGNVIGIIPLKKKDEIMFISKNGLVIRTSADQIREIGRATQGVRVMRLNPGDKLVSLAKVVKNSG